MGEVFEVVVVGGGISGLATCYFLQDLARKASLRIRLTLVESTERLGGKILTDHVKGMVIEGGPDSFFTQKPWALNLCIELGLSGKLVEANKENKGTYVLINGHKLSRIPDGTEVGMPTKLVPFLKSDLLSPLAKLRALFELAVPRKKDKEEDESVGDFFTRRFGRSFTQKIAEPLVAGIFAGDAYELSVRAVLPRMAELESTQGSLIRGMARSRRKLAKSPPASPPPTFFTLRDGMGELVDSIVSRLDRTTILTSSTVLAISSPVRRSSLIEVQLDNGKKLTGDTVVLATPADTTAKLVDGIDEEASSFLAAISYASTATVSLAFKKGDLGGSRLEGHGLLVPHTDEGEVVTGCTWTSSKWPVHSPSEIVLLRCYVGWAKRQEFLLLEDATLIERVREFLRRVVGISGEPTFARVYRWERALPQYTVGHLERMAVLERALSRLEGIFVTGSAYHGVGLPDCIHEGELTAEKVVRFLIEKVEEEGRT